ncbi:MAG: pesticin C-terminus-like muramidase [Pseudomonadota bacterium]
MSTTSVSTIEAQITAVMHALNSLQNTITGMQQTSSTGYYDNSPNNHLRVQFGQRTFDSEGLEAPGPFFSRTITWPKLGNSGVTIGRGYDMGQRSSEQIIRELTSAGMNHQDAQFLARAAFKRGTAARDFVTANKGHAPVMPLQVQKQLFEKITTPEMINDIKRIFSKPDVTSTYGRASWEALPKAAKEILFDLRYRGDYTPTTRRLIQPLLVNNDYQGLRELINDTTYWAARGVPSARIRDRQELAKGL